jgi:hypothetical protein
MKVGRTRSAWYAKVWVEKTCVLHRVGREWVHGG